MSPRAAWRLETLGFTEVYDYVAGKKDWGSFGLPRGGRKAEVPSAGAVARGDVPTCALDERLQDVRARLGDWATCIVVNDARVVLGRLGRSALRRADDVTAEEAMTEGPRTKRPSIGFDALLLWMVERKLTSALITTSDGRLVGVVLREDLERIRDEAV